MTKGKSEKERECSNLKSLFKIYWKVYKELKLEQYLDSDTRKAFFSKAMHCFRSSYINNVFFYEKLVDDKYMEGKIQDLVGNEAKFMNLYLAKFEYLQFTKTSLQLLMYSSIESSIRSICNSLNIGKSTDAFSKQYKELIVQLKLSEEYNVILEILTLIRNTVHNNGVYVDHKGNDKLLEYNNVKYNFIHMEAIDFVTTSNLKDLYRGVLRLFKDIISHGDIKKISLIKEYYYDGYKEGVLSLNPLVDFKD